MEKISEKNGIILKKTILRAAKKIKLEGKTGKKHKWFNEECKNEIEKK